MNNINIDFIEKLITPLELKNELNLKYDDIVFIENSRKKLYEYFNNNNKQIIIVGPCSIHNYNECIEYAKFIEKSIKKYDNLFIIMRLYFEKPRTINGWKGYLYDPNLDNSNNIKSGIYNTRKLLLEITKMKIPIGTEFLDTIIPQYIDDLISWGCIGARTVESQLHRQLASGLSMFIGFKNRTDGDIKIAINGMLSAREPHTFLGIDINGKASIIHTNGNNNNCIILRGSSISNNINEETLIYTTNLLNSNGLNPNIIIDLSHGNSLENGKHNYKKQIENIDLIISLKKQFNNITGIMIESNINENKQNINNKPLKYGISITDACINIKQTDDIFIKLNSIL
jgi:3-deoxy-7-phosphoheptulonate synthase